jgi:iron only hydrogenase large subunit-like protein
MSTALTSKQNDCRSCYKCIRNCPTKSISFQNGQASIIPNECVMCGACYLICPQNCKVIRDDLPVAKALLKANKEVYVSLAPSFLASFPESSFESMRTAIKALGFTDVEETAIGATIVKKQYDALCDDGKHDVLISTCCHSVNLLIEKHYPEAAKYLADVLSPMLAHGQDIKKRHPGAKVVFVGPCISKKNEIEMYPDYVDCVLTFLELEKWLSSENIVVNKDVAPKANPESRARLFPTEGGILETMERDNPAFTYLSVGGMDECIAALKDILSGKVHHAFIEMSSCSGSCINGPAISPKARAVVSAYLAIHHSAGKADFKVNAYSYAELKKSMPAFSVKDIEPSEEQIRSVLAQIGKTSPKDELNCSSCGYPSCREKAIAVIKGKASLEMCLPFLMEKAKSFSTQIVEGSDNAILVVNEDFKIQLANKALATLVHVPRAKDLVGKPLSSIFEEDLFSLALCGTPIKGKKLDLPEYGRIVEATLSYDPQFHIIIAAYHDVTELEKQRQKEKELADKTAEVTSQVIEKNMRAVQEIASLLGESTAETKVALTQLKDALKKGQNDE